MITQLLRDKALVIRADADAEIGAGHFIRSLALGQEWRDAGGRVVFVSACSRETLLQRVEKERFTLHRIAARHPAKQDLRETLRVSRGEGNAWVALDGYFFDPRYHRSVAEAGLPLLAIDDNCHLDSYDVDVLLNQNIHADTLQYTTRPDTTRLLGTRYVLLRKEFLEWARRAREIPDVARRILITFGGSDTENLSVRAMEIVARLPIDDIDAVVVAGPGHPGLHVLRRKAKPVRDTVRIASDPEDMPSFMSWAELAVSGGGSTLWELAFMGVPTVACITADNQSKAVAALDSRGLVRSLAWGWSSAELARTVEGLARDRAARQRMSALGRELVDGMGAKRVLKTLAALLN